MSAKFMGQVIFDETDKPLMRMTYKGLCDDAEWQRHLDVMSDWARRGQVYGVVIDAREVGRVPATQRKGIIDWRKRCIFNAFDRYFTVGWLKTILVARTFSFSTFIGFETYD